MSPLMHDRGRGPELRRIRLTVNDLFPYFECGKFTDAELLSVFPITQAELDALRDYITEHREEVVEVNRRVDERIRREIEAQNTPEYRARFAHHEGRMKAWLEWLRAEKEIDEQTGRPAPAPGERLKAFLAKWNSERNGHAANGVAK